MPEIGNFSGAAMPPTGKYAVVFDDWSVAWENKFQSDEQEQKYKFVFQTLEWTDETGSPGELFVRAGINYGNSKATLTQLMNCIFGRALSSGEWRRIDFNKMKGVVKGYAHVIPYTKQDGTQGRKFGSFEAAPGLRFTPEQFFSDAPTAPATVAAPMPSQAAPPPPPQATQHPSWGQQQPTAPAGPNIPNPFPTAPVNGTGANAPF